MPLSVWRVDSPPFFSSSLFQEELDRGGYTTKKGLACKLLYYTWTWTTTRGERSGRGGGIESARLARVSHVTRGGMMGGGGGKADSTLVQCQKREKMSFQRVLVAILI